MSDDLLVFLLSCLLWWTALFYSYCALLLGLDHLINIYRRRQADRRSLHASLAAIDADGDAAVCRLVVAYAVAQQQIRNVAQEREGRR